MTVHCCYRGYLATETNILLLKIQNTNEYGIKIKYHRRYLMLILHTISQCKVCLQRKHVGMFCYLVNANVVTIATALDFSVIQHFSFNNNFNAFTLVPNIRINHHCYHHTSIYNSNLVFVMILHQKVINGKELREITQRT